MKKKIIIPLILLPVLAIAGIYTYVLTSGPRMKVQENLRPFQAQVPLPPPGSVMVNAPEKLPLPPQASLLKNPVADTAVNRERGNVYYHYYCVFCHGEKGAGNGPVGESYQPVPTDLRAAKVRNFSDGELLRAMLVGIGHEPVLERVVPPPHRWYVVLYVRALAGGG